MSISTDRIEHVAHTIAYLKENWSKHRNVEIDLHTAAASAYFYADFADHDLVTSKLINLTVDAANRMLEQFADVEKMIPHPIEDDFNKWLERKSSGYFKPDNMPHVSLQRFEQM